MAGPGVAGREPVSLSSTCSDDPNFATICSFIEKFGETCQIGLIPFDELQRMLENTTEGTARDLFISFSVAKDLFISFSVAKDLFISFSEQVEFWT